MKPILKFAAFIFLTGSIVFNGCEKEKPATSIISTPPPSLPPPPPAPIGKTINARVVEYNSGNPIAGAVINLRPDYPYMNSVNLITDQNGAFSFVTTTNQFGYITVNKQGYWDLKPESSSGTPILFYPDSTIYDPNKTHYECDSFVVKLFSKTYVTVHIKDSLDANFCSNIFYHRGIFSFNGNPYFHDTEENYFILRRFIDTTFQCSVFGNTVNEFSVQSAFDDDCSIFYPFYTISRYMNGNSMTINITY